MADAEQSTAPKGSLFKDRLFKASLVSTIVMIALCLSTHLIALAGLAGVITFVSDIEHGLLFAAIGFAALTVYAVIRHWRCANCEH